MRFIGREKESSKNCHFMIDDCFFEKYPQKRHLCLFHGCLSLHDM